MRSTEAKAIGYRVAARFLEEAINSGAFFEELADLSVTDSGKVIKQLAMLCDKLDDGGRKIERKLSQYEETPAQ